MKVDIPDDMIGDVANACERQASIYLADKGHDDDGIAALVRCADALDLLAERLRNQIDQHDEQVTCHLPMNVDLDELERKARAATPGPWAWRDDRLYGPARVVDYGMGPERDDVLIIETDSGVYPPESPDAEHIAANSPDVTLALVARVREQAVEIERLTARIETLASLVRVVGQKVDEIDVRLDNAVRDLCSAVKP